MFCLYFYHYLCAGVCVCLYVCVRQFCIHIHIFHIVSYIFIFSFIFGEKNWKTNSKQSTTITFHPNIKASLLFIKMTKKHMMAPRHFQNIRWCASHTYCKTLEPCQLPSSLHLPPILPQFQCHAISMLHPFGTPPHTQMQTTTTATGAAENQHSSEWVVLLKSWPVVKPLLCLSLLKPPDSSICSGNPELR